MVFPLATPWKLASDFNEPRATSIGRHEAWDLAAPEGTKIHAPEDGALVYHAILRSGAGASAWWSWPDGLDYWFSNYYLDTYGGLLILFGREHTHAFCHINLDDLLRGLQASGRRYTAKKHKHSYSTWVRAYLNLVDPRPVAEGDPIGFLGTEGNEQGAHIHYELHPPGAHAWGRQDPTGVWGDPSKWGGTR